MPGVNKYGKRYIGVPLGMGGLPQDMHPETELLAEAPVPQLGCDALGSYSLSCSGVG
jgi:hypothetical protein